MTKAAIDFYGQNDAIKMLNSSMKHSINAESQPVGETLGGMYGLKNNFWNSLPNFYLTPEHYRSKSSNNVKSTAPTI